MWFAFTVYGTNPVKTANENSQEEIYLIWRKNRRTEKNVPSQNKQTNKSLILPYHIKLSRFQCNF